MPLLSYLFLNLSLSLFFAHAGTVSVCSSCDYKSIALAVSEAPEGSTIQIFEGIYNESEIVVTKPMTLIGHKGRPTIDGGAHGDVISVRANGVTIAGLKIINSGVGYSQDFAGLKIMESKNCTVFDNEFENNQFGIYLGKSASCRIERNRLAGNSKSESVNGNGVHIWYGNKMELIANTVMGHRDGFYFEFVTESTVTENKSNSNLRYGLHFMFSDDNKYEGNVFSDNGSGVAVMYSKRIAMQKNTFRNSLGPAAYGMLLKDISASTLSENIFVNNTVGAYLEGTTRTLVENNVFESNGWALRILGDCDSNSFTRNDFVANTLDVSTNSNSRENRFFLNFWSRYKGLDLNHDRVGDDVYYPVQLSTLLMEKYGASVLLFNSFFFKLLDELEGVFPALTPSALKDSQPSMERSAQNG
jgi:nitrous oxidase accessory protein